MMTDRDDAIGRAIDDPASLDGWVADGCHNYLLRVQFEDTDAGGIVYHANYLAFAERARSSYLRLIGINQETALGGDAGPPLDGAMLVVRRLGIDYVTPAGLGTAVRVETRMKALRGASMQLQQSIMKFEDGHILARLLVDIVCVAASKDGGKRPRRIPSAVVDRLRAATPPDTASG
ncbi:MAG: YbgC/FadM family acyl-CoA thioesterase [Candidatus Puniceispirillaceae bacterium]|jgi:acyl-CoA thioester hydrolase